MKNPVRFFEVYVHHVSRQMMLNEIHKEQCQDRSAVAPGQDLTVSDSRRSVRLARDLAGILVLAGLRNGAAVTVGGRYYALSCDPDPTTNPVQRARKASLLYGQYNLVANADPYGGASQQFLADYTGIVDAYATKAGYALIADQYPTSLYLSFLAKAIRATQAEVRTMFTQVAIPVVAVGAVRAVLGTVVAVTSPVGWALTGVLAAAGLVTMVAAIRQGVLSLRRNRTVVEEVDRSLGQARPDAVEFLLEESTRLASRPDRTLAARRSYHFFQRTTASLAERHEAAIRRLHGELPVQSVA